MPSLPGDGSTQSCPTCATLIDVSGQEPLAKIQCPNCGASMRVSRQINHFTIIEALGNGGMGEVYKALDRNLNRMVALKLLRPELSADEDYIIKLEDEARITASINHPYVVKVFSFDQDQGQYYIAMELVDKGSLDDLMQLQHRVAELQVLQVGMQVASGLQAAHERGLIHRDVKPGNILFANAHTAKITDFGLALLAEHEAEARGEIWGTPYYIAPEKLNHEPEDFRSDIYSLGGTLFHAVAGRPPFEAETASLVALKHLKSRAVSLQAFAPDVSSETAYVINRMLNKDPAERYASYEELLEHLKYASDTLTSKIAQPRVAKERVVVEPESQRNLAGLLTLLLLAILLVGGVLAFVLRDRLFGAHADGAQTAAVVSPAPGTPNKNSAEIERQYVEARQQVAAGQYDAAKTSFAALAARPNLVQPLPNWIKMQQGLLALVNHQPKEARDIFADLQKTGAFSERETDSKMVSFFTETGRYLADEKPIPVSVTKIWNKNTFENLSILLFGLKDWELGSFDNANKLLQEYLAGKPADGFEWMSNYAPIASQRVHDYALYAPLRDQLKANSTDPAARTALQAQFAQARGQLQTAKGKLAEAFDQAEAELQKAPAPVIANDPGTTTTTSASPSPGVVSATPTLNSAKAPVSATPPASSEEAQRWQAALGSYQQMVRLYRFDQAVSVVQKAQVTAPELVNARDQTFRRAKRLVTFKRNLLTDLLTQGGYPQPVVTKRSATFQRGIQSATADNLVGLGPYGTVSIPWTDLTPKTIFVISNYFADKTLDPKQAAERRWAAATFALENSLLSEGRALAERVAREQPGYKDELASLLAVGSAADAR